MVNPDISYPLLVDDGKGNNPLLKDYTSDNSIVALVDGKEYMEDLLKEMNNLGRSDFVLVTGWEFWKSRWLDETTRTALGTILRKLAYDTQAKIVIEARKEGNKVSQEQARTIARQQAEIQQLTVANQAELQQLKELQEVMLRLRHLESAATKTASKTPAGE